MVGLHVLFFVGATEKQKEASTRRFYPLLTHRIAVHVPNEIVSPSLNLEIIRCPYQSRPFQNIENIRNGVQIFYPTKVRAWGTETNVNCRKYAKFNR